MKELWGYIKGFFITLGLIITLIIALSIFESASPDWSGNPIDDLLYYAYNYEEFGPSALFWRLFIIYSVIIQTWLLTKMVWGKLKSKLPSLQHISLDTSKKEDTTQAN